LIAHLLGKLFLAPCQLLELLQNLVDIFLLLFGRASALRSRLILVLFGIEFEIEQAGQVAATTAATTTASALLAEGNLNLAERRFGAQQVLQCFLLTRQCILPALALQFVGCR